MHMSMSHVHAHVWLQEEMGFGASTLPPRVLPTYHPSQEEMGFGASSLPREPAAPSPNLEGPDMDDP